MPPRYAILLLILPFYYAYVHCRATSFIRHSRFDVAIIAAAAIDATPAACRHVFRR